MNKKKGFQLNNVLTVSFAHLIHDVYTSFLSPVTYLLIDKFTLSNVAIGFLYVCQRAPMLFNPYLGIIAERTKSRYFIIIAPAISAISMSLLGIAPDYIVIALLVFIAGSSSALFHVPSPVMIKKVSANKIGKGMSFYMTFGNLARTLGPLAIVGSIKLFGFENSYYLMPAGILTSIFLYFRLKNIEIRTQFEHKKKNGHYWKVFTRFLPVFIIIAGIIFFTGFMKVSLAYYLPLYLKERGSGLWFSSGISLSILYGASAVGASLSGTLSDKLGRRGVIVFILIISPLLMYAFTFLEGFWILPFLALTGIFLFSPTPVILAVIHELDSEHLPFLNSIYMTINFVLNSVITLLVGLFSDTLGFHLAYQIAAFMGLLAIPFGMRIPRKSSVT